MPSKPKNSRRTDTEITSIPYAPSPWVRGCSLITMDSVRSPFNGYAFPPGWAADFLRACAADIAAPRTANDRDGSIGWSDWANQANSLATTQLAQMHPKIHELVFAALFAYHEDPVLSAICHATHTTVLGGQPARYPAGHKNAGHRMPRTVYLTNGRAFRAMATQPTRQPVITTLPPLTEAEAATHGIPYNRNTEGEVLGHKIVNYYHGPAPRPSAAEKVHPTSVTVTTLDAHMQIAYSRQRLAWEWQHCHATSNNLSWGRACEVVGILRHQRYCKRNGIQVCTLPWMPPRATASHPYQLREIWLNVTLNLPYDSGPEGTIKAVREPGDAKPPFIITLHDGAITDIEWPTAHKYLSECADAIQFALDIENAYSAAIVTTPTDNRAAQDADEDRTEPDIHVKVQTSTKKDVVSENAAWRAERIKADRVLREEAHDADMRDKRITRYLANAGIPIPAERADREAALNKLCRQAHDKLCRPYQRP